MRLLERPHIRLALRVAGWICVVAIAILSLMPRDKMVRTSLSGHVEHFIAYAGCAGLWMLAYAARRTQVTIVGLLIAYAGLMEFLQRWVPGRHAGIDDWAASSLGALAGAVAAVLVARLLKA